MAGYKGEYIAEKIMKLYEISADEVFQLYGCLKELSEYHNCVSENFKGAYPSRPYEKTIEIFKYALEEGYSRIAVIEENGDIAGFCKADINGEYGKLDYLIVLEKYRGRGFGNKLMDWVMNCFKGNSVKRVEVKVIYGNEAVHLYEKYGFKINAQLLWCNMD